MPSTRRRAQESDGPCRPRWARLQARNVNALRIADYFDPTDDPRMLGRFGGYEIVGIIGCGGMGVVLKGFEPALDRYVAIKLLAPHLATSGAARTRFAREARAAAAVLHENVVAIHRVSEAKGLPYLVMPYMPGESLQKRLDEQGPMQLNEILRIGMQIAAGLAAAHAQGLIHSDIKPGNILLDKGVERVTITDFGLARAADDASLTRSGVIAGTPQYMSPEQARGRAAGRPQRLVQPRQRALCHVRWPAAISGGDGVRRPASHRGVCCRPRFGKSCRRRPSGYARSSRNFMPRIPASGSSLLARSPTCSAAGLRTSSNRRSFRLRRASETDRRARRGCSSNRGGRGDHRDGRPWRDRGLLHWLPVNAKTGPENRSRHGRLLRRRSGRAGRKFLASGDSGRTDDAGRLPRLCVSVTSQIEGEWSQPSSPVDDAGWQSATSELHRRLGDLGQRIEHNLP